MLVYLVGVFWIYGESFPNGFGERDKGLEFSVLKLRNVRHDKPLYLCDVINLLMISISLPSAYRNKYLMFILTTWYYINYLTRQTNYARNHPGRHDSARPQCTSKAGESGQMDHKKPRRLYTPRARTRPSESYIINISEASPCPRVGA